MVVETLNKGTEKDFGVKVTDNISLNKHIKKITGLALNLLKNARTAFEMMRNVVTMIRSWLNYAAVVWSPHEKNLKNLERVQRMSTKMVPELWDQTYEKKLKTFRLTTLDR